MESKISMTVIMRWVSTTSRPSSLGSYLSATLMEQILLSWCRLATLFLIISVTVIALDMALPVALMTIVGFLKSNSLTCDTYCDVLPMVLTRTSFSAGVVLSLGTLYYNDLVDILFVV